MIPRRKPAECYSVSRSPLAILRRARAAFIGSGRVGRSVVLLLVLVLLASTLDGNIELARERDRADRAQEQLDALAAWHREQTVRVSLEGNAATVANLAGRVANVVRP